MDDDIQRTLSQFIETPKLRVYEVTTYEDTSGKEVALRDSTSSSTKNGNSFDERARRIFMDWARENITLLRSYSTGQTCARFNKISLHKIRKVVFGIIMIAAILSIADQLRQTPMNNAPTKPCTPPPQSLIVNVNSDVFFWVSNKFITITKMFVPGLELYTTHEHQERMKDCKIKVKKEDQPQSPLPSPELSSRTFTLFSYLVKAISIVERVWKHIFLPPKRNDYLAGMVRGFYAILTIVAYLVFDLSSQVVYNYAIHLVVAGVIIELLWKIKKRYNEQ